MMEKMEKVLKHLQLTIEWAEDLKNISEKQWRTAVEEGKWTIAEIIGHFPPWDEFVRRQRLPYFLRNEPLPQSPDSNKFNAQSAFYSRQSSKEQILAQFIHARKQMIIAVKELPATAWNKEFQIAQSTHTLYSYFKGLQDHDFHHFQQIESVIN